MATASAPTPPEQAPCLPIYPEHAVNVQRRAGQGQPSPAGRVEQRLPGALPLFRSQTQPGSGLAEREGGVLQLAPCGGALL